METQAVGETPTITCECKKAELPENADMVKLADTSDLGSDAERCAGSSPVVRTSHIVGIMTITQPSL